MMNKPWNKMLMALTLTTGLTLAHSVAWAQDALPATVQTKVETYQKKLVEWAGHPTIVAAAKEANAKGALPGMTNGKWNDLDENDPQAKVFETSAAGVLISKWEADKNLNKLLLRDEKGNLAAASMKPLIYNNASRPPFANAIKGQPWMANKVKPDPSSGVSSVQASAPVMDGGKVIGVLQAGVTVE